MGADYYPDERPSAATCPSALAGNCHIECAILDKNVRIGDNVVIRPFPREQDIDHELYSVRDGIVVIAKDTEIPSGTKIAPRDPQ
jgi:glucose-1-phosphate adenylyltransferase